MVNEEEALTRLGNLRLVAHYDECARDWVEDAKVDEDPVNRDQQIAVAAIWAQLAVAHAIAATAAPSEPKPRVKFDNDDGPVETRYMTGEDAARHFS